MFTWMLLKLQVLSREEYLHRKWLKLDAAATAIRAQQLQIKAELDAIHGSTVP